MRFLLILIFLAGCSKPTILCLGDSTLYARNEGVYLDNNGFPTKLEEKLNATVINDGFCGGTAYSILQTYVAKYGDRHFEHVIIRVGYCDHNPENVRTSLNLLIPRINSENVILLKWETPTNETDELNKVLKEVAENTQAKFLETGLTQNDFRVEDKFHFTQRGANKIAEVLINETAL